MTVSIARFDSWGWEDQRGLAVFVSFRSLAEATVNGPSGPGAAEDMTRPSTGPTAVRTVVGRAIAD